MKIFDVEFLTANAKRISYPTPHDKDILEVTLQDGRLLRYERSFAAAWSINLCVMAGTAGRPLVRVFAGSAPQEAAETWRTLVRLEYEMQLKHDSCQVEEFADLIR